MAHEVCDDDLALIATTCRYLGIEYGCWLPLTVVKSKSKTITICRG